MDTRREVFQTLMPSTLRMQAIHTSIGNWILHNKSGFTTRRSTPYSQNKTQFTNNGEVAHIVIVIAAARPTSIAADMSFWYANKTARTRSGMPGAHDSKKTAENELEKPNC
jgi:hypothetical protein